MEPFEDDTFVATLESLRPTPAPTFVAELDERAAAGFPPSSRVGDSALSRIVNRLRSIEPRRALVPAAATGLAAVAAITVVVAVSESGDNLPSTNLNSRFSDAASSPPAKSSAGKPNVQYEAAAPNLSTQPQGAQGINSSSASATAKVTPPDTGPYAAQAPRREIERSAELVLGTDPPGVRKAASEVFETVHAYRGIVLGSSIRDGAEGEAGARFSLLIPSAKLGDALAAVSEIAEVRSRHEATADITAPTVRTGEQLRDSRAKIEGLLAQLAGADTEAERVAAEAELRAERRHSAYLRSQLSNLRRRANLSRVELRIETGSGASSSSGGSWGIGDALGDAGHILAIVAGVTIVGLAIVAPLALIALLAWLATRAWVRRVRQRALT